MAPHNSWPAPFAADVAVVGAGPAGCVAAVALARAGVRVLLLEAHPGAAGRLAGEWLHPSALEALGRATPGLCPTFAGDGFAVFPEEAGEPVLLPYADGARGASCEHSALVGSLREAAEQEPGVRAVSGVRIAAIDGERLTFSDERRRTASLVVERIVGADGRSSLVRRLSGIPGDQVATSSMAGIVLDCEELPFEGFGHLLLGGPGPVLIYRIGAGRVRACLDVPRPLPKPSDARRYLWTAYGPVFPEVLIPAFRTALLENPVQWASNQFRTRRRAAHYGADRVALVGDAVGCFHPLTAIGLALGFADAECFARTRSLEAYRSERLPRSRVPELLAGLLYEAFTRRDEGTVALRSAMYEMWRQDPRERDRTMRLLSGDELRVGPFSRSFAKVVGAALGGAVGEAVLRREWQPSARSIGGLGWWLRRLAAVSFSHRTASRAALNA